MSYSERQYNNTMLTSASAQYLHPDYLHPLPTTLDAKKSPLAMLAQTCSSIGKDTSPGKSLIPPIEKKDKKESGKHESSSKSESPHSGGEGERTKSRSSSTADKRESSVSSPRAGSERGDSPKSGFRAPAPKEIPPLVPISSSADRKSPSGSSHSPTGAVSKPSSEGTSVTSVIQHSVSTTSSGSGTSSNSRISLNCGSMLLEVNHQEAKPSLPGLPTSAHANLYKPHEGLTASFHPGYSAYPGCPSLPLLGHPGLGADASAAYHAAMAAHGLGKAGALQGAPGAASALSPYLTYARVKTAGGATTLVPVCKDPYCTGCQMTMQSAQLQPSSACGAGCTQCSHEKSLSCVPTSLPAPVALGGLHLLPPSASSLPGLSSSLYPHFGVLPGHQGLPYVCNWMAGSEYCGKRFNTSEELLNHLRTHTSGSAESALAGLPYSSLGLAMPGLCHSHYSTAGSLSPNSALRQAYPRTLSPNSVLAARYHPYKTPLSLSSPAPGSVPPLGAYYPYALYGQRLGAS